MDISTKIRHLLVDSGISAAELARRIGVTPQALNRKMKTGYFTVADLEQIAQACGRGLVVGFVLPDGQTIMQTIPAHDATSPSSAPASPSPADPTDASGNA